VSWSAKSTEALDKTIPVTPPLVKRKIKPKTHKTNGSDNKLLIGEPTIVASQLKTFIPVGTAIIIVAAVKYARVSISIPTVNIWWAQTINPKNPIPNIANIILKCPKTPRFPPTNLTTWETIPNAGNIKIYTSGCPKNQKMCWNKIGSPPPAGSKKLVLKFRSVNNIVKPPANTGRDKINNHTVIKTLQTNNGIRDHPCPTPPHLITVAINFIEAKIELSPATWREKIAKSTDGPAWAILDESGGYTVQPVAAPNSIKKEFRSNKKAGTTSQNLIFFKRGKIMSTLDNMGGINQLPNPPINIGITKKNIIINPWAVIIELYKFFSCNTPDGTESSNRIIFLKAVPTNPLQTPKIK
jgi:hypothetical protein